MNKLIIALIAGAFATVAGAQTPAPAMAPATKAEMNKAKAETVDAATKMNAPASQGTTNQAANVAKSKMHAKPLTTRKEKQSTVDAVTKAGSGSSQGTKDQAANVAASKASGAADPAAKKVTPAEEKAMQKASKNGS